MFLLQESQKRSKIIKEKREVLNERIRVAENQADVGWKLIQLDESTWCLSAKREYLNDPTFSCFHKNVNYIHLYHKNITRTATLKCTLKYYEYVTRASRSNTGTTWQVRMVIHGR